MKSKYPILDAPSPGCVAESLRPQLTLFPPESDDVVNVASVPQRSPFRYPGGKTWLIPTVRSWFNSLRFRPQLLIEPFAGGGSIGLLAAFEGFVSKSLLVELDPDIASVWRTILRDSAADLQRLIQDFKCDLDHVNGILTKPCDDELSRAFCTLVRNRVSRGGILAPGAGLVKTGESNKGIASRWYPETLAKRISEIHSLRSKIEFIEADGLQTILNHAEDTQTAFFVDPPYPVAGRRLYRYHDVDHRELFRALKGIKGSVLITYDHSSVIQALAEEFGFETRLVPMKSTHHERKYELLIGKDLTWLGPQAPASAQIAHAASVSA
jgi:DNA adenine methylase